MRLYIDYPSVIISRSMRGSIQCIVVDLDEIYIMYNI